MKRRLLLSLAAGTTALLLGGCASQNIASYAGQQPALDLQQYFNGTLDAYGVFTDRSGVVVKRFTVVMQCSWDGDNGVLDEDFTYSDGTKQKRIWTLQKIGAGKFTAALVARFPNLSVIDIDAVLKQVRATIDQVSAVVEAVFYFSLMAGILVLVSSVSASQDERLLEGAVMRVLGGSRRQMLLAQASEFAVVGLLAGLAAAIGATILSSVVAREVFDLPWRADWQLVLVSSGAGVVAAIAAGMLATRRVLSAPPSVTLRNLQE